MSRECSCVCRGMPTYNRGAPSLPAICFIYPITRHYGRIVNAAVPGNDWLFIITRGIRVISCAQATVKNRTRISVSRKITVVFHRAFVHFIWTFITFFSPRINLSDRETLPIAIPSVLYCARPIKFRTAFLTILHTIDLFNLNYTRGLQIGHYLYSASDEAIIKR